MSKLVVWWHWLVAAFFTFLGVELLGGAISRIPTLIRQHPQEITYYFISDAWFWLPLLLCAWGIMKWHAWARTLSFVVSLLHVVFMGVILWGDFHYAKRVSAEAVVLTLISCSVLTWLLLPGVKAEYLRRNQIA